MKKTLHIHQPLILVISISLVAFLTLTTITASETIDLAPPGSDWVVTAEAQARTNAGDCADRPGEVCKELCMHNANDPTGALNPTGYFECHPES